MGRDPRGRIHAAARAGTASGPADREHGLFSRDEGTAGGGTLFFGGRYAGQTSGGDCRREIRAAILAGERGGGETSVVRSEEADDDCGSCGDGEAVRSGDGREDRGIFSAGAGHEPGDVPGGEDIVGRSGTWSGNHT